MEPAPLPPHERSWRHPSELGPTDVEVDGAAEDAASGRGLILATGAIAALLVAVMVVAVTPRPSDAPNAVSATTAPGVPAASIQLQRPIDERSTVRVERSNLSRNQAFALAGAPNAVSAAPVEAARDPEAADELSRASAIPSDETRIVLLTESHTYDVAWGDLDLLDAPDGSIVITREGELIATFVLGELRLLVD